MRGSPRLVAGLSIFSAVSLFSGQSATSQTSTPEGLRLLRQMQAALGGADRIAAIRDYEETIRGETWNPDGTHLGYVRKRTRWIRQPNVLRLDQIGARDTYVLYFDGSHGWEILPDVGGRDPLRTSGVAIDLAGGELAFARNYLSGFQINLWLADRMPGFIVSSPAPNRIRIAHDGTATDFTLDPQTSLPIKTNGVSLANPDRPVPAEMRYEAWTEVAGVRLPTKRANYLNGLKLGAITEATIRVNVGLNPRTLAAKPADFAPVIPQQ
jgi:hypothetical protein